LVFLAVLGWLGIAAGGWSQEPGAAGGLVNPVAAAADGEPAAGAAAPPAAPATEPQQSPPQQSPPVDWLAGTPDFFGDFFRVGSQLAFYVPSDHPTSGVLDLPLAGGSPRLSVAENNGTLSQDRIYFLYNHFQNALTDNMGGSLAGCLPQALGLDQYTLGFEKSFLDRTWSVELRMPLVGANDFTATNLAGSGGVGNLGDNGGVGQVPPNPGAEVAGGNVGNLAVVVKHRIYESDTCAAAIGLGIDTPTGSDVQGHLFAADFVVHNQAVCLVPFIGFLKKPGEDFFYQGFLSVNVPINGNRIEYCDQGNGWATLGTLDESTLLQLDLEAGRWLYRNPAAVALTGFATVVELHYTTSLQNADHVGGVIPSNGVQWQFGDVANRADILDLTIGLHGEFAGHTLCRVGLALPLQTGANRCFDSELEVQLERQF
jgi:hypothetical protein